MIKRIALGVLFSLFAFNCFASNCDFITDNDVKYYCYALKKNSKSYCDFIKDNDFKYTCRAEITKNSSHCEFVKNNNMKQTCRIRSGK